MWTLKTIAEQSVTNWAEPTAQNGQMKGNLHERMAKLSFVERLNNVADLRYSILSGKCVLQKCQIASGGVCSGETVLWLSNASSDIDASIDTSHCHTGRAQIAI